MDARRFDSLARALAARATRRRAVGGVAAGGLLGALGQAGASAVPVAAQAGICALEFLATVRQGPSTGQASNTDPAQPADLRGTLRFALTGAGALEGGSLLLEDGTSLPVVGQASGVSLQVRIAFPDGRAMVAVGVGEQPVTACQGAFDGLATGPEVGDLGDWHAIAQGGSGGHSGGGRQPSPLAATPTATPAAVACPPGETRCERGCVDLSSDLFNCGACGNVCQSGLVAVECRSGRCERADCPPDQEYCGAVDLCRDLRSDPEHCGVCGNACPAGEACVDGRCEATCSPGLTRCGGECVDLAADMGNCGACGAVCESGLVAVECRGGECVRADCPPGVTYCGAVDGCRDLTSDPAHCGACGNACPTGQTCANGQCGGGATGCPAGQTRCADECVDLASNDFHCGACGNACAALGPVMFCEGGVCVQPQCPAGTTDCNGYCADLATSAVHCGACGNACAAGQSCVGGACVAGGAQCAAGLTDCGGVCVDLATDAANCGECGIGCVSGICTAGQCVPPVPD